MPNSVSAPLIRRGWISLGLWIAFGILIEGLIGFRTPALLDDPVRRDMFVSLTLTARCSISS